MTLDTSKMEPLRVPYVEKRINAKSVKEGMSHNLMAGDAMCLTSGRWLRWSIAIEYKPLPQFFLSAQDQANPRATDQEVAYVLKQFGLFALYELNAKSPHQNTIRSFHVRGQAQ